MISGNLSAAPLDRTAKLVTILVVFMAGVFPFLPRMPIYGAVLMPLVIFITWMFSVKGYTLMDTTLTIHRPFWDTNIELPPDAVFKRETDVKKGLIRTAGNGGLFGYTGGFRNKKLGFFRAYATNLDSAVSITGAGMKFAVLISPESLDQPI